MTPPSMLMIKFYDGEGHVVAKHKAFEQVPGSGLVYAPQALRARATRDQINYNAARAEATTGSGVYRIDRREAAGVISAYPLDSSGATIDPCPDCVIYFLCNCLNKLYGVDPSVQCPTHYEHEYECKTPDLLRVR